MAKRAVAVGGGDGEVEKETRAVVVAMGRVGRDRRGKMDDRGKEGSTKVQQAAGIDATMCDGALLEHEWLILPCACVVGGWWVALYGWLCVMRLLFRSLLLSYAPMLPIPTAAVLFVGPCSDAVKRKGIITQSFACRA